eukprot:m.174862 g.174862  ORF g.174862 m.174862 type:complete len:183 (-) comp16759_c0_seq2:436-984(-)
MAQLNALPVETLQLLVHQTCDSITGTTQAAFHDHDQGWSLGQWRSTMATIKQCVESVFKTATSAQEIEANRLEELGLDSSHASAFADAVNARFRAIRQALLFQAITKGATTLIDMDWQAGLTVASNSLANVSQPLVTLLLKLRDPSGDCRDLRVELDRDELEGWLTGLKQAQTALHAMTEDA